MAICSLTGSQPLDCKDAIGGIAEIKIKAWPGTTVVASDFASTSGTVTIASTSRSQWYTYGIEKETASYNDDPQPTQPNGTLWYKHQVKLILNKTSARLSYELNQLAKNRLLIALKDMNGNCWLFGMNYGMDLDSATVTSGTARGDRSGYDLTFVGKEDSFAPNMSTASYAQLVS